MTSDKDASLGGSPDRDSQANRGRERNTPAGLYLYVPPGRHVLPNTPVTVDWLLENIPGAEVRRPPKAA